MRKTRIAVLFIGVVIMSVFLLIESVPIQQPRAWGVTFAYPYMESFGIDWKEAYTSILDDLGVRDIRIPVYWPEVAPKDGVFVFENYDYQMDEAASRKARVILAVGRKAPRWPECHEAVWANGMTAQEQQPKILEYITRVVEQYRSHPALEAWQVENEPFLSFGVCPPLDVDFLDKEIALVHSLDPSHPVIVTDSGELSVWARAISRADIFGTTMYRHIYKSSIGYYTYPLPPSFFRLKRALAEFFAGRKPPAVVIELQGEPWGPKIVYDMTVEEAYQSLSPKRFQDMVIYAEHTGFDTFYWWGVEWWYWLKVKGDDPTIWNIAKELFRHSK